MPETIYEVQNICHRESMERYISMQTRIIQFMLYAAVFIFTFLSTMWGARTHDEYLIDTSKRIEFEFGFVGVV